MFAAGLAGLIGAVVLSGWWFHISALKSILPGVVSMKPNTALAFVVAGMALALLARAPPSLRWMRAGQWLAGLVVLIGGLTLCEYIFGCQLGLDELLFRDDSNAAATLIPGRMAPSTAVCFVVLGLSLVGIGWEPRRGFRPAEWLVLAIAGVSLISLVEYAVGQPIIYGFSEYTRMALHTASSFIVLSAGVLLARPAQGMVGLLRAGRIGPVERAVYVATGMALLVVLALGGWFFQSQEQQARQDIEKELQIITRFKVHQIATWRTERLADAVVLEDSLFFREGVARWMAAPTAEDEEKILTRLRAMQTHSQCFDTLLLDAAGRVRLSVSGQFNLLCLQETSAFSTAMRDRKTVLTDLPADGGEAAHLDIVTPLFVGKRAADRPVAVIIQQVAAKDFLYPLIQTWPVASRTAETLLVRRDGENALFLNELRHQKNSALKLRIPLNRTEVPAVMAVLGKEGLFRGKDYRGVKVISVLSAIPDSPWFMIAKMDVEEAFAPWRKQAAFILVLIVLLVIVVLTGGSIVRQMSAKVRLQKESSDKIRQLNADLERRVIERTAELRENEERFLTMANNISQLAWMADAQGSIFWYNQRWFDYTGTTLEEMFGWGWQKVHHPDHVQRVVDKIKHCFDTGEVWEDTFPLRGTDGQYRWFLSRAVPIRDEHGAVLRWFGTNTDITEHKQAEDKINKLATDLQTRANELDAANKELEAFSYSVSHDLRAPLRHVHGYVEMLTREAGDRLSGKGQHYLKTIADASQEMGVLIDNLLNFSRMGRSEMVQADLNLDALVQETLRDLEPSLCGRHIVWKIPSLPAVQGDRAMLKQVFVNLLGNAVKYTRPRDPAVIEIGIMNADCRLRIAEYGGADRGVPATLNPQSSIRNRFLRAR